MENKKMGIEDLYLAPEHSNASAETSPTAVDLPMQNSKKSKQMKEIRALREKDRKVFSMGDGMTQAVFFSSPVHVFDDETRTFEDVESTLTPDEDGRHFTCGKNHFVAKFSR